MRFMRLLGVGLVGLLLAGSGWAAGLWRIGVLSFQNKPDTLTQWSATAQWLSQQLKPEQFQIVPLTYEELDRATASALVDFVFTNPEHYVVLRNRHHLRPMVTLSLLEGTQVLDSFGAVIFTRADNDIHTLQDVRGRRIAAVNPDSLGGFLMGADEFRNAGIDLTRNPQVELEWTGVPHSRVAQSVMAGQADVGMVRTGVLEQMQAKGQLRLEQLRVLNPQPDAQFPLLLSTALYPEWPFAAQPQTPNAVVKAVTMALLSVPPESPAAQSGHYFGFSSPADYTSVEELMRRLGVYPGMRERALWQAVWQDYPQRVVFTLLGLMMGGVGIAGYFWSSNRRLRELTKQNLEARTGLEVAAAAFNSQVGLIITDAQTRIRRANPAMARMLGYTEQDLLDSTTSVLRSASVPAGSLRGLWQRVNAQGHWEGELMCQHANGSAVPCMVTISCIHDAAGQVTGFVGSFTDITEQKKAEGDIRQLAYYDPLTRLPNRRMFLEQLQTIMDQALANGTLAGIMFVDLDHFKNLNDAHGHSVGDQLLRLIAQRLMLLVGTRDLAARLGGDEFVIVLPGLDTSEERATAQTLAMAQRIHEALLAPFELDTGLTDRTQTLRYTCSGSIGVALFGLVPEPLTEVLKRADVAMYKSKQDGRNLIREYDPAEQKALNARMGLSNDLNLALRDGQLQLLFQVQVDAHIRAVGAECLMRWHHPVRGLVSPAEFIPLAEESGAIIAMGDWVIHSACETLVRWAQMPAMCEMTLSVNVSPRQFSEHDFVLRVQRILADTGARPRLLRLEVTEGIILQDSAAVIERMQTLCAMGLTFSIDDFGTGYSSLSYIQMLPLAELKIDKAFVNDLGRNPRSEAIVRAILALGQSMGITIVSEGVETQAQQEHLLALGCTLLQGYLFTRPVVREELEALVAQRYH
jgi:diguanylate cyclase (GGDEF)-like protein/PAS domain S-box-containing protein